MSGNAGGNCTGRTALAGKGLPRFRGAVSPVPFHGASASDLASATPADRDRFLDLVRAASILVVVLGHWLMAAVVRRDGVPGADNALAYIQWLQPVTWLLQVMPVFFMVGGAANAWALSRPAASTSRFLGRRVWRLLAPTLLLAGGWMSVLALLSAFGVADVRTHDAATVAAQPLWFLAVYLLLAVVAPAQLAAHRRAPVTVAVALPVLAVLLDAARLAHVGAGIAIVNYLVVFMVAQELGFWYADGKLVRLRRGVAVAAAAVALAVLTLVTTLGPYPVSMVGVPGEAMSNMGPPTVCIILVTVAQVGLLLAARPALLRWLQRSRSWRLTMLANSAVLSVFLWHLSAYVVAAAVLLGLGLPTATPGSAAWWLAKPAFLLLAAAALAIIVVLVRPVELLAAAAGRPRRTGVAAAGAVITVAGLAGLAAGGFAHPFAAAAWPLGIRLAPVWAVGMLVGGGLLAVRPCTRRYGTVGGHDDGRRSVRAAGRSDPAMPLDSTGTDHGKYPP